MPQSCTNTHLVAHWKIWGILFWKNLDLVVKSGSSSPRFFMVLLCFPFYRKKWALYSASWKQPPSAQLSKPSLSGMWAQAGLCQAVCALPAKAFPLAKQASATTANTTTVSQLMGSNAPLPPRSESLHGKHRAWRIAFPVYYISFFLFPHDPSCFLKFRDLRD